MAKRVPKTGAAGTGAKPRKSAAPKAADEAQMLDPSAPILVGGEEVVVREYGFFQKQRIAGRGAPFLAGLEAMVGHGDLKDAWDGVRHLIGEHEAFVKYAVSEAIGKPLAWVEALPEYEIEPLVYLWWAVAGRFFFGEVASRLRGQAIKATLDGSMSSTPLAATSSDSAAAPSGS